MATATSHVLLLTFLSLALSTMAITLPPTIEVPHEHPCKVQQTLHAKGYQWYRFNGTSWLAFNATARLYNSEKQQVGHHFFLAKPDALGGQATWESRPSKKSGDVPYSCVTCSLPVAKVVVEQESIPWVLLERTQSKGDEKYFGDVTFVQRINTKLGLAPRSTKGARVGDVKRSPYTADYLFYVYSH